MTGVITLGKVDKTNKMKKALKDMAALAAYVGIPQAQATRQTSRQINNAQLLFIHTNGSPLRHIPPRPVIEPAIEAKGNKEPIAAELGEAAKATFEGKAGEARTHLERAGMRGMNAARGWFDDPRNNWAPNALSTVRAKLRRKFKTKKALTQALASYTAGDPDMNTVLVDTDQMRKAITYVVSE